MIFNFCLALLFGYEIHQISRFNLFFRIKCISIDYKKSLINRVNSVAYKELMKIVLIDFFYIIVLFIGLFTINHLFFTLILFLSVLQSMVFKYIKNQTIIKFYYIFDIFVSSSCILLSIINLTFYKLDGIQFINKIFNIF